jgi:hypothetical protein
MLENFPYSLSEPEPVLKAIIKRTPHLRTILSKSSDNPKLRQSEVERARSKRPDSLVAYDLYSPRPPITFIAMPETADQALDLLQQAVTIEPNYAAAHADIAFCQEGPIHPRRSA